MTGKQRKTLSKILKSRGWRKIDNYWCSPYHKIMLQKVSLKIAAEIENLIPH